MCVVVRIERRLTNGRTDGRGGRPPVDTLPLSTHSNADGHGIKDFFFPVVSPGQECGFRRMSSPPDTGARKAACVVRTYNRTRPVCRKGIYCFPSSSAALHFSSSWSLAGGCRGGRHLAVSALGRDSGISGAIFGVSPLKCPPPLLLLSNK